MEEKIKANNGQSGNIAMLIFIAVAIIAIIATGITIKYSGEFKENKQRKISTEADKGLYPESSFTSTNGGSSSSAPSSLYTGSNQGGGSSSAPSASYHPSSPSGSSGGGSAASHATASDIFRDELWDNKGATGDGR